MNALEQALVAELASASEHLLERGAAPLGLAGSGAAAGPGTFAAGEALRLARLVAAALVELERVPSATSESHEPARVPKRARPSTRAFDYVRHGAGAVPVVWTTREPIYEAPRAPLEWLLALIERASEAVERHLALYVEARDEAVRFRGGSAWGAEEVERLEANQMLLTAGRNVLRRAREDVAGASDLRLVPRAQRPHPFPRTPAFAALADVERRATQPTAAARALAATLFAGPPEGVELGYLYQRWCGLKLVEALRDAGYAPKDDPIPTLLLSGAIEFDGPPPRITLLCEPRLVAGKAPIGGLFVHHGESTPDFALVVRTDDGPRVHVLDPTLRTTDEGLRSKSRYLEIVKVEGARMVAGVGFQAGVDTSWAAAPLQRSQCKPDDWRGQHGTVPLNPVAFDPRPVRDWLAFVLALR